MNNDYTGFIDSFLEYCKKKTKDLYDIFRVESSFAFKIYLDRATEKHKYSKTLLFSITVVIASCRSFPRH